jgi:hypothetical protein
MGITSDGCNGMNMNNESRPFFPVILCTIGFFICKKKKDLSEDLIYFFSILNFC